MLLGLSYVPEELAVIDVPSREVPAGNDPAHDPEMMPSRREELRKRITSLAAEGEHMVLLDNLAGPVGNDVLDAALTSDHWKDRVLGSNRVYNGPLHVVWFGTGNNCYFGSIGATTDTLQGNAVGAPSLASVNYTGLFAFQQSKGLNLVIDGTSNTVAFAESTVFE